MHINHISLYIERPSGGYVVLARLRSPDLQTDYIYSPDDVKSFAEQKYVTLFESKGYHILNDKKSIGNVGYSRRKWKKELCHIEVLKYSKRWSFQKNSVNTYSAAKSHGWLDSICSHMKSVKPEPNFWSKENIISEAKKYTSRNEFRKKATYLYKIMTQNGWTDEVCSHLPIKIYRKWENKNANKEVWFRAQEFYERWIVENKL